MKKTKPVLGIMPRSVAQFKFTQHRIVELARAIERKALASEPIPCEWANELNQHLESFGKATA